MKRETLPAVIVQPTAARRRVHARHRKSIRQRIALAVSMLSISVLLAAFMPWSGTTPDIPAASPLPIVTATPTAADKPEYIPPAAEVEALARMLYGEARGIASDTEKAACVWCVLNRVDNPLFPDTVLEVLEQPNQFSGYSENFPVAEDLKIIAADVLTRYHAEKNGEENVGRVLPPEYCFFTGDGERNYFTVGWKDTETWGWTLESPYEN